MVSARREAGVFWAEAKAGCAMLEGVMKVGKKTIMLRRDEEKERSAGKSMRKRKKGEVGKEEIKIGL